jgi:hypothetical protein
MNRAVVVPADAFAMTQRAGPAAAGPGTLMMMLLVALLLAGPADAAVRGTVTGGAASGFARLLFEFDEPVEQQTTLANSVLVIQFSTAIDVDTSRLGEDIPGYIAAARLDPDMTTMRIALGGRYSVNTIVARNRVYVDLLPESWTGPPPGLPQEVVAELIRLAEQDAEREAQGDDGDERAGSPLAIHVGRYPTFSRVVFEWSRPTNTVLSRENDNVMVAFDRASEVDLSRLNADPPPHLTGATVRHGDDEVVITLAVDPGTDVRGFQELDTYIVDLANDAPVPGLVADSLLGADPFVDPADGETRIAGGGDGEAAGADAGAAGKGDAVEITVTPLELDNKEDGYAEIGTDLEPEQAEGDEEKPPAPVAGVTAGDDDVAEMAPGSEGVAADPLAPVVVESTLVGQTLRLTFPFVSKVASAAFQRASTLWVVFDSDAPIEAGQVVEESQGLVTRADLVRARGVQMLRLNLTKRVLATSTVEGTRWIVSIGDLVLAPTQALELRRALREDGEAKVTIDLPDSGRVHWIEDEEIGDQLAIVTAYGPARGLIKRQEFVDFTALTTAHGVAVRPHADDVAVRLVDSEVLITRQRGLNISAGRWPRNLSRAGSAANASRPGFVDFESWHGGDSEPFRRKAQTLMTQIAQLPEQDRANFRLRLVRLFLAHELSVEALGVLRVAEEEDGDVVNDPVFRAMRGIARLMAGRFARAREDLLSLGLDKDPHAALWRVLVEAADGDWSAVLDQFEDGRQALAAYPPVYRARFQLAAARAALETGAPQAAAASLEAVKGNDLAARDDAERGLLRARLAEALGESEAAMAGYSQLAGSRVRPVAVEAELRRINAFLHAGLMTREDAISALESVTVIWRGDELELSALRKLAELYVEDGRYRAALEAMKTAVVNHESGQLAQLIGDDITRLFNRLFLDGLADGLEPIAALGLYYDFRELTPVGRRGDEMIRKLAHRLVEVDLLDQAADLLDHQVSHRLTGAARAQVAADLSLIHLMGHKPELALRAIHQTRQAVLPEELQERRNILEARALAELGRVELAVEILDTMSGFDIERLKSDALWRGERWLDAGEQLERMLGARWQEPAELSERERLDVLKAAIGYALADDAIGLERLRRKFMSKMASSPDASSFDVVTATLEPDSVVITELAKEIASIDTLEAFLTEYRSRYGSDGGGADTGS